MYIFVKYNIHICINNITYIFVTCNKNLIIICDFSSNV
jgi:hypothetical protein